jgi:hypothetical protein
VRYAGESGDLNDIHHRDDVALDTRPDGAPVHDEVSRFLDYQMRFTRPVYVDVISTFNCWSFARRPNE